MDYLKIKKIYKKALEGKYAIPALNVNNMEMIQGIMKAVKEKKSPIILQVSKGARKYASMTYLMKLIEAARKDNPEIPIILHLDHGDTFELIKDCIEGGFNSVMIDASLKPFEENVNITKEVVDYAHKKDVWVEAELGKLAGIEEDINVEKNEARFTDPEEAKMFVSKTNCDSLAVAVGTSHGAYKFKSEPYLSYERIKEISKLIPKTPLVLHGASSIIPEYVKMCNDYGGDLGNAKGVPEGMLSKASELNICKINIDSDLRLVMTGEIRKHLVKNPDNFDPRKYLGQARLAFAEMVKRKINMCGSDYKI